MIGRDRLLVILCKCEFISLTEVKSMHNDGCGLCGFQINSQSAHRRAGCSLLGEGGSELGGPRQRSGPRYKALAGRFTRHPG